MRKFEIHITGAAGINHEFDALGIKNIMVQLLKPNMTTIRTEFMSSFIREFETYEACYDYVQTLVAGLTSKVIRIKIESPIYEDYIDRSIYMEAHYTNDAGIVQSYPLSRNAFSGRIMGTDRTYIKSEYDDFMDKWREHDLELCLFDDYIREDFDWFKEYNDIKIEEPCHINTGITSLDQILLHGIPKGHITMLVGKSQYGTGKSHNQENLNQEAEKLEYKVTIEGQDIVATPNPIIAEMNKIIEERKKFKLTKAEKEQRRFIEQLNYLMNCINDDVDPETILDPDVKQIIIANNLAKSK